MCEWDDIAFVWFVKEHDVCVCVCVWDCCTHCPGYAGFSSWRLCKELLQPDRGVVYEHLFYEHSGELLQSCNVLTQASLSFYPPFSQARQRILRLQCSSWNIYCINKVRKKKKQRQFINFSRHHWGCLAVMCTCVWGLKLLKALLQWLQSTRLSYTNGPAVLLCR